MAAGAFPVGSIAGLISISGATEAQRDILGVQRSMTLTGESATRTAAGLDSTAGALGTVGRASSSAATGSAKLRAAQLSAVAATERYTAVLADEDASLGRLASAEAAVIRANERVKASTPVAAMTEATAATEANAVGMSRASTAVSGFARTAAGLGLAIGGFELLRKALDIGKQASQFQQSMLLIQTNANASAQEVRNMTQAVLTMSPQVATKPEDLANALYHVEQNGLRGKDALDALRAGAEGAKIGLADVEDTTNTMTIAVASGIKGMGNLQQAMGTMIAIAGTGDMRLKDLNEALSGGILSVAKGYGASLQDVAAVLATLGDNGIRGADAATALRQTMMGFAQPAAKGKAALQSVGLEIDSLAKDMESHGLVHAMNDLNQHMIAAGVTGSKVGAFITAAFGKKAGAGLAVLMGEIDRLNTKFREGEKGAAGFASKWAAEQKTAAFQVSRLGALFESAGIRIAEKFTPAVSNAAAWLSTNVPHALGVLAAALGPSVHMVGDVFVGAWHGLIDVLGPVASALGDVGHFLAEHQTLTTGVVTGVLAMWAAWKGYQIVTSAVSAIRAAILTLRADAGAIGSSFRAGMGGARAEASLTALTMQADFASITAEAEAAAAAQATAAAESADAWAAMVGASDDATANMVANANAQALAAQEAADVQVAAAAEAAGAAETAAAEVDAAGASAAVGWSAALGPVAALGIGIGLLTALFGSNNSAAQNNATIMKGYADSLKQSSDALAAVNTNATVKNLQDQKDVQTLQQLHAASVLAGVSQADLVLAVNEGGTAYDKLHASLQKVIADNTTMQAVANARGGVTGYVKEFNSTADAAIKLSGDLKTLRDTFTAQQKQQMLAQTIERDAQKLADGGASAASAQAQAIGLTSNAYLDAQAAAKKNTDQTNAQTAAFQIENDAVSLLKQALDGLAGVNLTVASARTAMAQADLSVAKSFHDNGNAILGNTAKAVANQQAIQGNVQAARQLAEAIGQQTHSSVAAKASLMASRDALLAQLSAQHRLTPALKDYITSLYDIKDLKIPPTKFDVDKAAADAKIKKLQAEIDAVKQGKIPGLSMNNESGVTRVNALQALIDALRQGKVPSVNVADFATGEIIAIQNRLNTLHDKTIRITTTTVDATGHVNVNTSQARAAGGFVHGPGSATSDSIPTRLSDGEFVVRAQQAKKYAGLLTAINSGAPAAMVNRSAGDYYASQPAGPVNQRDGSQAMLAELGAERRALLAVAANLTAAVAAYTGQPVSVAINDREVARSVERSGLVESYLDEAARLLQHGRAAHR